MNIFIKSLFFLMLSLNFLFASESKNIFKVSTAGEKNTEIIFDVPEIDIVHDSDGFSKFNTNDEVGTLENKDFPELPIYSSLFQMTPGVTYNVEYEVISSYFIENINFKANSNNNLYPSENISLS